MVSFLQCTASGRQDFTCAIVRTSGELDIATLHGLEHDLSRAFVGSPLAPHLVVDLTAVTFLDCSALRVLIRAQARAQTRGGWLRLVHSPAPTGRLLRHAGLTGAFPRYVSPADALRDVRHGGDRPLHRDPGQHDGADGSPTG